MGGFICAYIDSSNRILVHNRLTGILRLIASYKYVNMYSHPRTWLYAICMERIDKSRIKCAFENSISESNGFDFKIISPVNQYIENNFFSEFLSNEITCIPFSTNRNSHENCCKTYWITEQNQARYQLIRFTVCSVSLTYNFNLSSSVCKCMCEASALIKTKLFLICVSTSWRLFHK